jgi:hypothetical protein
MPIKKNHSINNTIGMMYSAVSNDDIATFRKVLAMEGDIYDFKGNGKFFPRALAKGASSIINEYLKQPNFSQNVLKYSSSDFYSVIAKANLESLKMLASLNLPIKTLSLVSLIRNAKFTNSEAFMLKATLLAFMMKSSELHEIEKFNGLYKNPLLRALMLLDFEYVEFVYDNRIELGAEIDSEVVEYIVTNHCLSQELKLAKNPSLREKAYRCLDNILDKGTYSKADAAKMLDVLTYKMSLINEVKEEQFDISTNGRYYFYNYLLTQRPDALISKAFLPYFYGFLLLHPQKCGAYLRSNREHLSKLDPMAKGVDFKQFTAIILEEHMEFSEERKALVVNSINYVLSESGISTANIENTIGETGSARKDVKKAILVSAVAEIGMERTVAAIKHVSYINAFLELGVDPYTMLQSVTSDKLSTRLTEEIMSA